MFRAFLLAGAAFDLLIAAFLLIVSGWMIDSWRDPRVPWAGPVVTAFWSGAFVLSAGVPVLAYWFSRRKATPGRVASERSERATRAARGRGVPASEGVGGSGGAKPPGKEWMPAILCVSICVVGLILSPP